jgi:hypothetical protein
MNWFKLLVLGVSALVPILTGCGSAAGDKSLVNSGSHTEQLRLKEALRVWREPKSSRHEREMAVAKLIPANCKVGYAINVLGPPDRIIHVHGPVYQHFYAVEMDGRKYFEPGIADGYLNEDQLSYGFGADNVVVLRFAVGTADSKWSDEKFIGVAAGPVESHKPTIARDAPGAN